MLDDDLDICPVCETECTCARPQQPHASSSTAIPKLKIKLTVPPSMLRRPSHNFSGTAPEQSTSFAGPSSAPAPRKRGRPPKATTAAQRAAAALAHSTLPKRKVGRPPGRPKGKRPLSGVTKKPTNKRKRPIYEGDSSSLSELDDDDAKSIQYPTFISASALSRSSASNSSASDSDDGRISEDSDEDLDDVDSEIEKEEEKFIRRETHERGKRDKRVERARVRREQQQKGGGRRDSGRQQQARRDSNQVRHDILDEDVPAAQNQWIIRTRRPSDAGVSAEMLALMDVDTSSSTASSDSSEDEEDGEDADAEPDEIAAESLADVDDEEDAPGYTGLATGWSDSEESSFDADIFFANLSDSHSSRSTGSVVGDDTASEGEDIGVQVLPAMEFRGSMELEVTEAWDGQFVFTNGIQQPSFSTQPTFGMMDFGSFAEFNPHVSNMLDSAFVETSPPPSQTQSTQDVDSDVEMHFGTDADEESCGEDDGNTTDEDLVGPDQLPNEKAMAIFRLPLPHPFILNSVLSFDPSNLSGVDPLSTVSPSGSPAPASRDKFPRRKSSLLSGGFPQSPGATDILSGSARSFWGAEDDEDVSMDSFPADNDDVTRGRQRDRGSPPVQGPVFRPFILTDQSDNPSETISEATDSKVFVVDDKHTVAPSPYRKSQRGRRRMKRMLLGPGVPRHKTGTSHDGFSSFFPEVNRQTPIRPSSMPPSTQSTQSFSVFDPESSDAANLSPELRAAQLMDQIDLDDVLEASFMDEDAPSDHSSSTRPIEEVDPAGSHLRNLSRWDLISVGAFKKTRPGVLSDPEWGSDMPASKDYGSAMRDRPLSALLWNNRLGSVADNNVDRMNIAVSPLLTPEKDRDGERTPTNQHQSHGLPSPNKNRKRDRKTRRKGPDAVHHERPQHMRSPKSSGGSSHPPHHHHTQHQHHPNSKNRSSGSSQRTNFFAPATIPSLSL
ncbi:hypothetical protein C8J56DRAFT_954660 [Mycena floridula]|nr:hypothetical protein C8J56DRAFT_954660 [Mycena floridula]